jgi:hypothetical protein
MTLTTDRPPAAQPDSPEPPGPATDGPSLSARNEKKAIIERVAPRTRRQPITAAIS